MRSNNEKHGITGESGAALLAAIAMLIVLTVMGMGMYKLVQTTVGVSSGYARRATTHSMAVAQAAMVMEAISFSFAAGEVSAPAGLQILDPNVLLDIQGMPGNDIIDDTVDNNPDFGYSLYGVRMLVNADVDFLQTVPIAGGSIEFASAYDGVGAGQTLGSAFLVEHYVHIVADDGGAKTDIRFITSN